MIIQPGTRLEEALPLPWHMEEMWSGTGITAANGARVLRIQKNNPITERLIGEWIIRCVNAYGLRAIEDWWAEMAAKETSE